MLVPGSNLLNMALSIQGKQTVLYSKWLERTENEIGYDVSKYGRADKVQGSFQPVPRSVYQVYGLDLSRNYATFYVSKNMLGVERDVGGDRVLYNGKEWQALAPNDWFAQDGWVGMLLVEFKKTPTDGGCCA